MIHSEKSYGKRLMTADGYEDNLIRTQDIINYVVPPPSVIEPDMSVIRRIFLNSYWIGPITVEEDPIDDIEVDDDLTPSDEGTIFEDNDIDRDYQDELVGEYVKKTLRKWLNL